jgi:hypothetical protein
VNHPYRTYVAHCLSIISQERFSTARYVPAARHHVNARILLLHEISEFPYAGTRNTDNTHSEDNYVSANSGERLSGVDCINCISRFAFNWLRAESPSTNHLWKANESPSRYEIRVATGGQEEDHLSLLATLKKKMREAAQARPCVRPHRLRLSLRSPAHDHN